MANLPNWIVYPALGCLYFLMKYLSQSDNYFPSTLVTNDSCPERFGAERARLQLERLTSLGPRVCGSYENEVLAVDLLKREISFVIQQTNRLHTIEMDVQQPTGSYYLYLKPYGFRNYYANIQNIVVRLNSTNSEHSVLLNCHYDTVPESPGASDNGLNCAVMLEILRVLATSDKPLKNNVIFLFNGAEENPLQASHGFLSQHKWSKEVKVVINLDSAGAGGREVLFQTTGESWLINAYAKAVPYPFGAVTGEEIFQSGLIPSDTDFRIFRDFGNYSGLDLAHCYNGYVYHTRYDTTDRIKLETYQSTGENVLALTLELVNSPELGKSHTKSKIVYFDVFNLFMVSYSGTVALVLNLATACLSFWSVHRTRKCLRGYSWSFRKGILYPSFVSLISLLVAACTVFIIAQVLDKGKATMLWYKNPSYSYLVYGYPIMSSILWTMLIGAPSRVPRQEVAILYVMGGKVLWTIVLVGGIVAGIRSVYMLTVVILPASVSALLTTMSRKRFSATLYLISYVTFLCLPVLYSLNQSTRILNVIVPMTARMGPHRNPEFVIGALCLISLAPVYSLMVPLAVMWNNAMKFIDQHTPFYVLVIIMHLASPKVFFPYSRTEHSIAPQRFYSLHCERTFHDASGSVRWSDSGIFVLSLDRNNLQFVSEHVPELKKASSVYEDCQTELYCGFPVYTSRFILPAAHSAWIPALPPTIHHPTSLEVVNQTQVTVKIRRMSIRVTGPDHISLVISPRKGVSLVRWSFDEFEPGESQSWNDRQTYMVYYSHGLMGGTLDFDVDLQISGEVTPGPVLDAAVIGHYMHDKKFRTKEFQDLIDKFPKYAHVTPWTTTYKSYVL